MSDHHDQRRARQRRDAAQRRTTKASQRWYGTAGWKAKRRRQLHLEPTCRMCRGIGRTRTATVADHITPHREDKELFWNGPLQSLCKPCHNVCKQREEANGYSHAPGGDGWPLDDRHPFNTHGKAKACPPPQRKRARPPPPQPRARPTLPL